MLGLGFHFDELTACADERKNPLQRPTGRNLLLARQRVLSAARVIFQYPERFAQQALGHNSKAVHHAYSKHAEVTVPALEDWEKRWGKDEGSRLKAEVGGGQLAVNSKRSSVASGQKAEVGSQNREGGGQEAGMGMPTVVAVDFRAVDSESETAVR